MSARFGGVSEKCRKCGKTVYMAERVMMQEQVWHIECLRCVECDKKLSGTNWGGFVDPEGENKPYCSIHLTRLVQSGALPPQQSKWEQRQAAGGGSTSSPSSGVSRYGGGPQEKCQICNKTVYVAEKLVMQGKIFHSDCLKCIQCNQKLSGANWGGFVPPEDKAYCNRHYMQLVQAQGGATAFSGSAGQWTPKNESSTTTTSSSSPSAKPASSAAPKFGGGGEDRCEACGKRAYLAEKIKMEGKTYHPTCLRCVECNKMLSGANWGGFVPPDNKSYCKNHYDRLVQMAGSAVQFSGSVGKWEIKN